MEYWKHDLSGDHCFLFFAEREQLLNNNHKHGSIHQYFNNNIDTSRLGLTKDTIDHHEYKVKLVFFEDPYDHINTMDNTDGEIHLIYAHEERIREDT